ncbi:MAG: tetratricopeptide repeat protein [Acidobacteriota bacterium]|nr:tetratricopeptide repeat protein [Acidobacteriota bacterium]
MLRNIAVDNLLEENLKSCFKFLCLFSAFFLLTFSVSAQCTKKKTRDFVNQGNESFKIKDFPSAIEFYQKAIQNEPNCSLAYFNLGQTQRFLNQTDAAIGSLERALNLNYPDKAAIYLALAGSYALKSQKENSKDIFVKARTYAVNAVKLNDKSLEAWRIIATTNRALGDVQGELNAWEQIVRVQPYNLSARREKGVLLYRLKEYQGSIAEFEAITKAEPKNPENFLALSDLYRLNGQHSQAIEMANRALQLKPDSPLVLFTLGGSYLALQNYDRAIEMFRSAINQKTEYLAESHYYIASSQMAQGKYAEAVDNLKKSLPHTAKLFPENGFKTFVNRALATSYGQLADFNQAINYLSEVKKAGLDDSNLYVDLSWWHSLLGEDEKALEAATMAIKKDASNPMAYTNRCRANFTLKRLAEAEQDCKKALELNSNEGETLFYYSRVLRDTNRKKEADAMNKKAIVLLEKAAGLKNANTEVVTNTVQNRNVPAAISAGANDGINYLLSVNVSSPYSTYILGNAYFDDNQLGKAINAYKMSLQRAPKFPLAHLNLGIVYFIQNEKKMALAQYSELVKIDRRRAEDLKKIIDQK